MRKTLRSQDQRLFLDLLRAARKNADLTQEALAAKLRRPQSFVAKYENGERRIDVVEFVDLAREINADPVALLRAFIEGRGRAKDAAMNASGRPKRASKKTTHTR
jgi:transcriptional regulator with XRE-family HTH domain